MTASRLALANPAGDQSFNIIYIMRNDSVGPRGQCSDQALTCGAPGIDPVNEAGLHLWKACDAPWTMLLTGDPGTGTVTAWAH